MARRLLELAVDITSNQLELANIEPQSRQIIFAATE